MEKTFRYHPENVCSKELLITVNDDGTIKKIVTVRGCPGNTQGVNRLCEGRKIDDVIACLSGLRCPGSKTGMTSCPNELSKALSAIKNGQLEPIE